MELTEAEVLELLKAMRHAKAPAVVDWTNRSIAVYGPVKEDKNTIMSDGKPLQYRDFKFCIRERKDK